MIREKLKLTNLLELLIKVSLGRESMVKLHVSFSHEFLLLEKRCYSVFCQKTLCTEMANKPRYFSHSTKKWDKKV